MISKYIYIYIQDYLKYLVYELDHTSKTVHRSTFKYIAVTKCRNKIPKQ